MDSLPVTGRIRSGASSGAQTNKNFWLPPRCGGAGHQAHCWALRQQARVSLATVCGGRRVVAPGFGGGVWCLIRG